MADRGKAGSNEKQFLKLMKEKLPGTELKGKHRFSNGEVEISVDESLIQNGITYLIEIDSGNMAKLIVGQYVLLNELYDANNKEDVFFIVVHTYKKYNSQRTVSNLTLIKERTYCGSGIRFGAMHIDTLKQWPGGDFSGFSSILTTPETASGSGQVP